MLKIDSDAKVIIFICVCIVVASAVFTVIHTEIEYAAIRLPDSTAAQRRAEE